MSTDKTLKKAGFSLMEVMVAMAILGIIVTIVAGIFQQTSLAWSIGTQRAEAQSMTRSVIGALNRDLSMIVDPNQFMPMKGDGSSDDAGVLPQTSNFSGGSLGFWIYKPLPQYSASDYPGRALAYVTYTFGATVKREEQAYTADGTSLVKVATAEFDLNPGDNPLDAEGSVRIEPVTLSSSGEISGSSSYGGTRGIRLIVTPDPPSVSDYEVAVGSCGPDGRWDTEDDIRSWAEKDNN